MILPAILFLAWSCGQRNRILDLWREKRAGTTCTCVHAKPKSTYTYMFTCETCARTHFIQAEILVLVGGAIPPAPAAPASTMISARLKRVQEPAQSTRECKPNPENSACLSRQRGSERVKRAPRHEVFIPAETLVQNNTASGNQITTLNQSYHGF